ncbi:LuxR family transcriptional regulator [Streptomyces sp. NPDC051576]|uniref:LuxR family transcriptional regulator n=1 Tax=Streptomyces sp. NPDC051576 TaxID=3155803 RepID=UPI0034386276
MTNRPGDRLSPVNASDATRGHPTLGETAWNIYTHAVKRGCLRDTDVAQLHDEYSPAALKTALDQLRRLGLLEEQDDLSGTYVPVDPRLVEARIGAERRTAAARLLEEAAQLPLLLTPFQESFQELVDDSGGAGLVQLTGKDVIQACVREAVEQSSDELLTAQPGGRRPPQVLRNAHNRTTALLERNVKVRMLYQHTARHDSATRSYVTDMVRLGAQVRTLDHFFERLIVVDRSTAFLPADAQRNTAVLITNRALVRFLVDVFDHNWQRAVSFDGVHNPRTASMVSNRLRETIVRSLIEGESDSAIAKLIGLSPRAYATHVAKLKAEHAAQTRFQLGYRLALSMVADHGEDAVPAGAGLGEDLFDSA